MEPAQELPQQLQEPARPARQRTAIGPDGRPQAGFFETSRIPGVPGGGFRAGLIDTTREGNPLTASFLSVAGGVGGWNDPRDGQTYGASVSGGIARLGYEPGEPRQVPGLPPGYAIGRPGFEVGHGTFSAGASANSRTAQAGAQFNYMEAAGTVAARIGGDYQSVRGGVSLGLPGYQGRAHYDDRDGNGVRELGFGADFGNYSFDVKSETLGRAYNWASRRARIALGRAPSAPAATTPAPAPAAPAPAPTAPTAEAIETPAPAAALEP